MKNNLKNTENKTLSEDNKNREARDTGNTNDNYFQKKTHDVLIGSCGRSCAECKIGDCLNG